MFDAVYKTDFQELSAFRRQSESAAEENSRLHQQIQQLQTSHTDTTAAAETFQNQLQQLTEQVAAARAEKEQLNVYLEEAKSKHQELLEQLDSAAAGSKVMKVELKASLLLVFAASFMKLLI